MSKLAPSLSGGELEAAVYPEIRELVAVQHRVIAAMRALMVECELEDGR